MYAVEWKIEQNTSIDEYIHLIIGLISNDYTKHVLTISNVSLGN